MNPEKSAGHQLFPYDSTSESTSPERLNNLPPDLFIQAHQDPSCHVIDNQIGLTDMIIIYEKTEEDKYQATTHQLKCTHHQTTSQPFVFFNHHKLPVSKDQVIPPEKSPNSW